MAALIDAGPLYAYIDESDRNHAACLEALRFYDGPLIVPQLVVAEVANTLGKRRGIRAEVLFIGDLAGGTFVTEPVRAADWIRVADLVAAYADLPLGTVDASLIALAERLKVTTVITLDRRHFSVVRPAHVNAFHLLP